jgi:peptide/nickel transport system substrate-binding protein
MKRAARQLFPVIASACLLVACSSVTAEMTATEPTGSPKPTAGGSITFAVDSIMVGFDPHTSIYDQEGRVMRQVFDLLLETTPDGEIIPSLAAEWEVSADGLQYDFELRQDVSFHDGTPFNAEAVCFNLDRIKDPATGAGPALAAIGTYESCTATSEFHARVRMSKPFAPFLRSLTSPFLGINSPTAVRASDPAGYKLAPVGSGPFILESFMPGDRVELVRNPDYAWPSAAGRHAGPALLDAITVRILPDPTVRMGSVRGDMVQIASGVPQTDAATIAADPDLAYIAQVMTGSPFQLHLNSARAPFDDAAVRQAAAAALDVDSALQALYVGAGERAWSALTPTTIGYDSSLERNLAYDPAEAARLLDDAGWLTGDDGVRVKDGQRLEITYTEQTPNREKRQDFARFFEANLEEAGFDVELLFEQGAPQLARAKAGDYDIIGVSLLAPDPNTIYQVYAPAYIPREGFSGFNYSRTDEPEITAALNAAREAVDEAGRRDAYAVVQKIAAETFRSIPIYVPLYSLAVNGVGGIRFDGTGYPIYYDAFRTEFGQ